MARPLKPISEAQVYKLARIGCTNEEIAAITDCSADTIERRFAGALRKGRQKMKMSLRRMQYRVASTGDKTMLIWLGKQYLGQKEAVPPAVDLTKFNVEQLQRIAAGEDPQIVASTPSRSTPSPDATNNRVN